MTTTVSTPPKSAASLRKTNKPLMEKKRRARINDSLTQLKSLVIQNTKKDSSQFSKLEKADILELTVKHLRTLQTQQCQPQQQSDSNVATNYREGFVECANEVIRYLGQADGFSDDTKTRVICHLASCLQLVSSSNKPAPVQPAQLPSRQIIQIVNTPFQNSTQPQQTTECSQPTPKTAQPAFISYNQPLQIQIPPLVSPVLIQTAPKRVRVQPSTQEVRAPIRHVVRPQVQTQLPSLATTESEPVQTTHKRLHSDSSEYEPAPKASRQINYPMSPPSSAFSSPTDSVSSPLNLTHSPTLPQTDLNNNKSITSSKLERCHPLKSRVLRYFADCNNSNNNNSLTVKIPEPQYPKHIDGRNKCMEDQTNYLAMMLEDERNCMRHNGTPSPASSMGEERLWRPW